MYNIYKETKVNKAKEILFLKFSRNLIKNKFFNYLDFLRKIVFSSLIL